MEEEPDTTDPTQTSDPPPFDPDPDLVTFLERGKKPTREELLEQPER